MINLLSEHKEILFSYRAVHDFFDVYLLEDALQILQSIFKAANTGRVWKRSVPYSLLYYIENLQKLSAAAFALYEHHHSHEEAVIKEPDDPAKLLTWVQACVNKRRGDNLWTCFPRSLSLQQFCDPYKAIRKYCSCLTEIEWKAFFAEIQEYALCQGSIADLHPPYNLLKLQKRLLQLIEACHLLQVRINIPLKEQLKKEQEKTSE